MSRSLRLPASPRYSSNRIHGVALGELCYGWPTALPGVLNTDYYDNQIEDYQYAAKMGFTVIRLAFAWERLQPTLLGSLDPTYKALIDEQIGWAKSCGLKIILDVHNFGSYYISGVEYKIGSAQVPISSYTDFLTKLAQAYVNEPGVYAYEPMNEPHAMPVQTDPTTYNTTATWYLAGQAAINAIRAVDTNKWLIMMGDNWGGLYSFNRDYGTDPTPWWSDPSNKVYYCTHQYFSSTRSGQYTGNNAYYSGTGFSIYDGGNQFVTMLDWANKHGLNLAVTEFAVGKNDPSWNVALNDFLAVADLYPNVNVLTTYWFLDTHGTSLYTVHPDGFYSIDKPQMDILKNRLGKNPI